VTNRRLLVYFGIFILVSFNYVDRVALSIAGPIISRTFHITPVGMGYLFSSFSWLYFVALIPWGIATDRFGARRVNAIGVAIWSCATLLTSLAWSFGSILICRIIMGAAEASTYPGSGRALREWAPRSEYGFASTMLNSGGYFGPALGTFLLSGVVALTNWRIGFVVASLLCFVWLAAWLIWYKKPEKANYIGAEERQLILSRRDIGASSAQASGTGLSGLLKSPTMWALALSQGSAVYTQYLFLTWLPSYLSIEKHMSIMKTGLFTAAPYLIATVLSLILAAASDRLLTPEGALSGSRRIVVTFALLSASVVLFAPFFNNDYAILTLITISLVSLATAISLNIALTADLLKLPGDAGKAMGIQITGGNAFGLMAPIVTGYIIKFTGSYDAAFVVAGALLLVGAAITMTLTRKPIEDIGLSKAVSSSI
jgi:MFS family permease